MPIYVQEELMKLNGHSPIFHSMDSQSFMEEEVGVEFVGAAPQTVIDKDEPMCKVTICRGRGCFLLSFCFTPIIGEGWTFSEVLQKLDREFSYPYTTSSMLKNTIVNGTSLVLDPR